MSLSKKIENFSRQVQLSYAKIKIKLHLCRFQNLRERAYPYAKAKIAINKANLNEVLSMFEFWDV